MCVCEREREREGEREGERERERERERESERERGREGEREGGREKVMTWRHRVLLHREATSSQKTNLFRRISCGLFQEVSCSIMHGEWTVI